VQEDGNKINKMQVVSHGEVRVCAVQYRLEVLVGEETPFDVESDEAVGGERDSLLSAEAVPEDIAVFQLNSCPDIGRKLTVEKESVLRSRSLVGLTF
jgi:hypothetical protein